MLLKYRAWLPKFERMHKVTLIDYLNGDIALRNENNGVAISDINSSILMQSTGIKDSNGADIFEGDIVKRTSLIPGGADLVGVVKMLEGCWVIDDGTQAVKLWTEVDENIVLGNIYKNPELANLEN